MPAGLFIAAMCSSSKSTSKLYSNTFGLRLGSSINSKTCPGFTQVPV